jgi:hypothetical protein
VPADEQIVFGQIPDEGPRAEGRSTTQDPDRETQQERK